MFSQMTFTAGTGTPRAAREFVRAALPADRFNGASDVSQLLTTELVANAVQHARSAPTVRVSVLENRLRVEVDDASTIVPVVQPQDPARLSGFGLLLVASLSEQWGADLRPGGKTVWFELALPALV